MTISIKGCYNILLSLRPGLGPINFPYNLEVLNYIGYDELGQKKCMSTQFEKLTACPKMTNQKLKLAF